MVEPHRQARILPEHEGAGDRQEFVGTPQIHGQSEAALRPIHPALRQIARRDPFEDQLTAALSVAILGRELLGEICHLDSDQRRPDLERMLHAHAVDLREHRTGHII